MTFETSARLKPNEAINISVRHMQCQNMIYTYSGAWRILGWCRLPHPYFCALIRACSIEVLRKLSRPGAVRSDDRQQNLDACDCYVGQIDFLGVIYSLHSKL